MKNYLLLFFSLTAFFVAAQTCPGPSQRQALLNLQKAGIVNGTRAYQIPMTDTCGNQRYVTLDSLIQIIADSIAIDTSLQFNWYTRDATTTDAVRTATILESAQWLGDNAAGYIYFEMGNAAGGRLNIQTSNSSLIFSDLGGTEVVRANTSGIDISTSATASRAVDIATDTMNWGGAFDADNLRINYVSENTYMYADSANAVGIGQFPNFPGLIFDGTAKGLLYDPAVQGIVIINGDGSTGSFSYTYAGPSDFETLSQVEESSVRITGTATATNANILVSSTIANNNTAGLSARYVLNDTIKHVAMFREIDSGDYFTSVYLGTNDFSGLAFRSLTEGFGVQTAFQSGNNPSFDWIRIDLEGGDTTANAIRFYEQYSWANDAPSATVGDTSFHYWAGNGTATNPGFITLDEVRGNQTNWYNSNGTTTDNTRIATITETATWLSEDVMADGVFPFRFELTGTPNEPEMMVWKFPDDSLTLAQSDQEIFFRSTNRFLLWADEDLLFQADSIVVEANSIQEKTKVRYIIAGTPNNSTLKKIDADDSEAGGIIVSDGTDWTVSSPTGQGYVLQNGNSFSASMVIGTNDNNTFSIETNGVTRSTISTGATTGGARTNTDVTTNTTTTETAETNIVNSTGMPGAGFGMRHLIQLESSTTNAQDAAAIDVVWSDATHATRTGDILFNTVANGAALFEAFRIGGTNYQLTATASVSNTNTAADRLVIKTNSIGPAAANFGGKVLFQNETSTTDNQDCAYISGYWGTATHATRQSKIGFGLVSNAGAITEHASLAMSGTNVITFNLGSSSTLAISQSAFTTGTSYTIGNSAQSLVLGGSSGTVTISSTSASSGAIQISNTSNTATSTGNILFGNGTGLTQTSGTRNYVQINPSFSPTSGTAIHNNLVLDGVFNQTGGANGITRNIYLNPTLTAVADFRGIEIAYSSSSAKGIYQIGANTTNNFVGATGFGATTVPTDKLEVTGNIALLAAGNKLKIATGSNASIGTTTLVGGTVTVNTAAVTTGSIIFLTCNTPGGTQGFLSAPSASIVNATSFVINSSNVLDTSTVNWIIIN